MSQRKQQSALPDFKIIYLIFRDNDNDLYFFGDRRTQKGTGGSKDGFCGLKRV
jgi:hypothetical protein